MYKRKARVVFAAGDAGLSALACGWAARLGAEWLHPRAMALGRPALTGEVLAVLAEAGLVRQAPSPLTDELLAWADLLVTLDQEAERCCAPPPAGTLRKHWPLGETPGPVGPNQPPDYRNACEQLRRRVEGMIGGMRLLARSDAGDT